MSAHTFQREQRRRGPLRRGVTLVEMMVTVVVLGIVGASTLPVILGVSGGYADATRTRAALERNAFAADRVTRWIREIPRGVDEGTVAIASADAQSVRLLDGRRLQLIDGTLMEVAPTGTESILLEGVTGFELRFQGDDGVTDTSGNLARTQRVAFTLTSDGATLSGVVFIRVRMTDL